MIVSDHGMNAIRTDATDIGTELSGGHLDGPPAFIAARGPLIAPNTNKLEPRTIKRTDLRELGTILDITPTLLAMVGAPVGRDMNGRVMRDLINPQLLEKYGIDYIRTHTDWAWKRTRPSDSTAQKNVAERIEQLQQLGYID
jgi:hypothetical protein